MRPQKTRRLISNVRSKMYKYLIFLLLITKSSLAFSQGTDILDVGYERYHLNAQVSKTVNDGKLFVLVFVSKPGNDIHDNGDVYPNGKTLKEGDGAYFPFLIGLDEKKTESKSHKYNQGKTYTANVKLTKRYGHLLDVEYAATVSKNNKIIYVSTGSIFISDEDF